MPAMKRTFRNRGGMPWWYWRRVANRVSGKPWSISDLTATAISATEIELAFTPAPGATSHQYRVDGGDPVEMPADLTVTDLTAETEYGFEVRGVNGARLGEWSNVATETTEAA